MTYWQAIWGILRAATIAAGLQVIAIGTLSLMTLVFLRERLSGVHSSFQLGDTTSAQGSGIAFLGLAYLLTAMGCALTSGPSVDATRERMQKAGRAIFPTNPNLAIRILLAQCALAAAALAALGFGTPPRMLVDFVPSVEWAWLVQPSWSAALSLGVAAFGATAYAAYRALR